VNQEEWIEANLPAVTAALVNASETLYALLGGQPDPEWERAELEAEVGRLRLTMVKDAGHRRSSGWIAE
jgi:hypothetical protein